jgi:hypothetical protein
MKLPASCDERRANAAHGFLHVLRSAGIWNFLRRPAKTKQTAEDRPGGLSFSAQQ